MSYACFSLLLQPAAIAPRPSVSRAFALLNLGGASLEVLSTSMDGMLDYNPWWVDDYSNFNGILTIRKYGDISKYN